MPLGICQVIDNPRPISSRQKSTIHWRFTMAVRSWKSKFVTAYLRTYSSISSARRPGSRAIQRCVHIAGFEQNVHWNGQPRVPRIGIERPRLMPFVWWRSMYSPIGNESQSGVGMPSTSRRRGDSPVVTTRPAWR